MSMSHITIKQRGQEPRPHRCHADATLFTCPFCSTDVCKPRQYHQIMTHIAGHKLRAVEYGDHVIYSCYIGCGKTARHFHCCQCPKIYINKGALKKHLSNSHPIATCTLKSQPVSDQQQEPPSQQPTSQPQQEPPSQQPASQLQQEPSSQKPQQDPPSQQPASQPQQEPSSQKPASHPQQEPPSQQPASQLQQEPSSQKPQQEPPSQQPASQPQQEPSSQKLQQEPSSQKPTSHPQQEPPSQQPASQPQQEPSSQKPQQEPPSQQPASQSQQEPSSQKPQQEPSSQQPASQSQQEPSSQQPQQEPSSQKPQQEPSSQQPASQSQQEPSSQKPQQEPSSQKPQQEPSSQQPASQSQQEPSSQQPQQEPSSQKPQQEPPSQQPASQPQQEPSSQKLQQEPSSQKPQQEPPSQQPASQSQQEPSSQQPQQEPSSQKPQQEPPSQQPASQPQQEPSSQKLQQEPSSQKPQQEPPSQQPASQSQQEPSSQQPQQEPPSQQPASQPQQEPSSQKLQQEPSSQQPQQEPSSQQPASHPLQLAAPPAIKRISVQCRRRHITIKQRGQEPRPHRCHADAALFTCPFCSTDVCKPRQYHQIMTHIAGHKLRAVEYGDHVIYSCNIGCGKMARHFHCFQCPKTYINKSALKKHLCSSHPIATCTLKPQPASDPLQEPPSQKPASPPQQESPSQQPSQPQQDPPFQQPASDPLQLAAPPAIKSHRRHITIKQRGQEPRPHRCHADATLFTCPFCSTDVCKPRQYHQIMTHIAGHKLRAVEYGDHVIYSCNSCGEKARHFHCCQCPKTYINKADLKKHLCSSHPIATCALKPQPVSDPQQEPPSEQAASQPQQEPPLQQPASPPLQLADPPAIKRRQISVQCLRRHITIKQRGQEPQPQRCHADAALFTCPFCTTDVCKPRKYNQIMTHIAGHKLSAVEYGDDVIYSCNSCGEKARHFHCCQCPQTYFNQGALKRHLCNAHPIATCTPEPHPVGRPLQEPPLQQPAPRPLELAAQRVIVKRKQISVQCPHCRVSLNSKNLKMHIKRKHHEAMHPITSTWDSSHRVICDIDICKSGVETAPRSELLVTQCVSLSSVDFSCAAETSEDLSEDMLTEME